jgi:predicted double-glycine peptidase
MTSLQEKAENAVDVVRAQVAIDQLYRLEDKDLIAADEIGNEDYPQYGDFADVTAIDANGKKLGDRWLECPSGLAESLVEANVQVGDAFWIQAVTEHEDGAWSYEVVLEDL